MTGTSYISNTNKADMDSANTNAEISFKIYANTGAKLYKNGGKDPYFLFKVDGGFVRVSLKEKDYISIATTVDKIEVDNDNPFDIDLEWKRDGIFYGKRIKAKNKKKVTEINLYNIYVSKVETKINETDTKPEPEKPNTNETDTKPEPEKPNTNETDTKPEPEKPNTNETGTKPEPEKPNTNETDTKPDPGKSNLDLNTEVTFLLFAPKGTELYRSGWDDPFFFFSDNNSSTEIYLESDEDDYISFLSDNNLSNSNVDNKIDISVENINDFSITLEIKTIQPSYHFTLIDPKAKITKKVKQSDKLFISRSPNPLYEISFLVYAKKGTEFQVTGWGDYNFSLFDDNASQKFYLKAIESLSAWSKTDSASKVDISIENINDFDIDAKIREGRSITIPKKAKATVSLMKSNKLFVERTIHETIRTRLREPSKFSLLIYAETGVDFFKNGITKPYFSFIKEGLSGFKAYFQDNDYIDIGFDKHFDLSLEKRRKKRRLIIKNSNSFCIIAIEENYTKTYIISSHSEAFIFFGMESRKLFLVKGPKELSTKPEPSQKNKIIIYLSFLINITRSDIIFRINGKPYSDSTPIPLVNFDELKLSVDGLIEPTKITVVIGSDPSNQNLMIKRLDNDSNASIVVRPGGIGFIEISLDATYISTFQVSNSLIQKIKIYETSYFKFPFIKLPSIKMKSTVSVDVLNTTLYDLKNMMKAERIRQDQNTNDCEVLAKMVYSTVLLDKEFKAVGPWVFAILFSKEVHFNPIKFLLLAVFKRWGKIGKYILKSVITMQLFDAIDNKIKELEPFKSKITYLMNREYSTFLFELDISDKGFIACMYRQAGDLNFTDFLGWLADIPDKLLQKVNL